MIPSEMPRKKPQNIGVFIDYENCRRNAKDGFLPHGSASYEGVFDPIGLAQKIVAQRTEGGHPSVLSKVWVFRGEPNPERQPKPAANFQRLAAKWKANDQCEMRSRDLKYRIWDDGTFSAQEKGVDVELAVTAIRHAMEGTYDVIVIFSNDTDLLPAVELIINSTPTHVEVAVWAAEGVYPLSLKREGSSKRMPFCHFLSDSVFYAVRDD